MVCVCKNTCMDIPENIPTILATCAVDDVFLCMNKIVCLNEYEDVKVENINFTWLYACGMVA